MPNLPTRRVMRVSAFDERVLELVNRRIFFIQGALSDADALIVTVNLASLKEEDKAKPVWIVLNSPGGEIIQGFAVCDAISAAVKNGFTVNILATGFCASMATAVLFIKHRPMVVNLDRLKLIVSLKMPMPLEN